jgi:hypothetical protein
MATFINAPRCASASGAVKIAGEFSVSFSIASAFAHWQGHASINTTNKYMVFDLEAKREALAKTKPLVQSSGKSGAWRHDSKLIAWLEAL